jgi:hypothetical protein
MHPAEVAYFSELLASLTVSAARTNDRERLSEIRHELEEAFAGIFTILDEDPSVDLMSVLLDRPRMVESL